MKTPARARIQVVALRHDAADPHPPRVVAKGKGETAERVLELARKHDIPVRADRDLLELLAALDIGDAIPTELFEAVAELLAYLYRLNAAEARGDTSAAPAPN
jgi:flagellar biosynthesis protein